MPYALILIVVIALLYGIFLSLNDQTPVPEGCTLPKEDCHSCSIQGCDRREESK